jgi:uncharacterized protein (UPF0262 family)
MKVAVRTTERVGKALLGVGIERERVDGHTDASGKEAYNEQLSVRRVKSVAPVATNTTSSGRNGLSLAWTRKVVHTFFIACSAQELPLIRATFHSRNKGKQA